MTTFNETATDSFTANDNYMFQYNFYPYALLPMIQSVEVDADAYWTWEEPTDVITGGWYRDIPASSGKETTKYRKVSNFLTIGVRDSDFPIKNVILDMTYTFIYGESNDVKCFLVPVFSGTLDGDEYEIDFSNPVSIDLSADSNAPAVWTWEDINLLAIKFYGQNTNVSTAKLLQVYARPDIYNLDTSDYIYTFTKQLSGICILRVEFAFKEINCGFQYVTDTANAWTDEINVISGSYTTYAYRTVPAETFETDKYLTLSGLESYAETEGDIFDCLIQPIYSVVDEHGVGYDEMCIQVLFNDVEYNTTSGTAPWYYAYRGSYSKGVSIGNSSSWGTSTSTAVNEIFSLRTLIQRPITWDILSQMSLRICAYNNSPDNSEWQLNGVKVVAIASLNTRQDVIIKTITAL
jgi:hypothetical protein